MSSPLLLDTCAAIWLTEQPDELGADITDLLDRDSAAGVPVHLSPVTGWEVGLLIARGRLALSLEPKHWFSSLLARRMTLAPLDADLMIDSSFLPHCDLRDPADRLIAATARRLGARVVTRDARLLAYAAAGHIRAVAC